MILKNIFWVLMFLIMISSVSALADLTVTDIKTSQANPPIAGETSTIWVGIANIGDMTAQNFNLTLDLGSTDQDKVIFVPELPQGMSFDVAIDVLYSAPGAYDLKATIDSGKRVGEANENNNELTKPILVDFSAYYFSIEDVTLSVMQDETSGSATFNARNDGKMDLTNIVFTVTDLVSSSNTIPAANIVFTDMKQGTTNRIIYLPNGAPPRTMGVDVNIPANQEAGVYTGTITADYGAETTQSTLTLEIMPVIRNLSVADTVMNVVQGQDCSADVIVTNIGTINLTIVDSGVGDFKYGNVVLSYSDIVITNPTGIIKPGNSDEIKIGIIGVNSNQIPGSYVGNITVNYGGIETAKAQITVNVVAVNKDITVTSVSAIWLVGTSVSESAVSTVTNIGNVNLPTIQVKVSDLTSGSNVIPNSKISINPSLFSLSPSGAIDVTFTISGIPSTQNAGSYTGLINVTYNGHSETANFNLEVRTPKKELSVIPSYITFAGERNNTYNKTVRLNNTGDVALNGIKLDASGINSKYKLSFSQTDIGTLNPGQSTSDITVSVFIPADESAGEHSIGIVKVTSDGANATFGLKVNANVKSMLIFTRIDAKIDGKSDTNLQDESDGYVIDKDAAPAGTVELKIKVKNDYSEDSSTDIKNIRITAKVDDLDIEEENANEFDLKEQKTSNEIILNLTLPVDVEEEKYELEIEAEGENEDGYTEKVTKYFYINVVKESTDLRVYSVEILPSAVSCDRSATLSLEVINFGQGDEDDVVISIESSALGLDITEEVGTLTDDLSSDDSKFKKDYSIDVPENLAAGTYTIKIQAFRETDDPEDFEEVALAVNTCTTPTPHGGDEEEETETGGMTVNILPSQQSGTETTESFMGSDIFITLSAIVVIAVLGLMIYGIGALTIRKH